MVSRRNNFYPKLLTKALLHNTYKGYLVLEQHLSYKVSDKSCTYTTSNISTLNIIVNTHFATCAK